MKGKEGVPIDVQRVELVPPAVPYVPELFVRSPYAPFVRSPYNYDTSATSVASGLLCTDVSRTDQSHREEADINTIVRRFGLTGKLPDDGVRMPVYGDFVGIDNYHDAMNAVSEANEAFDDLPAEVRARFHHDPGEFVDFCLDDRNYDEAKKLGLTRPSAVAEKVAEKVEVSDKK